MAFYYLDLTKVNEGSSFKYIYKCNTDDNYQCRIINDSIGCYHLCGAQGENIKSWCEQYKTTSHHLFRKVSDKDGCVLNPADGKYYSKSNIDTTFCPSERPCDNTNGCTTYTEKDGKSCNNHLKSECVEQDGHNYALICNYYSPATDPLTPTPTDYHDNYYVATPCEACEYNDSLYSPYDNARCLEKCSTNGDVKDICEDGMNVHSVCEVQSNGQTYWSIKSTEFCSHGCDADGKCKIYPGEGEACTPTAYQSKCVSEDEIMDCSFYKATVMSCTNLGLLSDYLAFTQVSDNELICLETDKSAECVTKKNRNPCSSVGQKTTRCGKNNNIAISAELVCKKYSDGSLRYTIENQNSIKVCPTGKCNIASTDCE